MTKTELNVYTDGSCLMHSERRPGGWGAVIYQKNQSRETFLEELFGNDLQTTNNQMELVAILAALVWIRKSIMTNKFVKEIQVNIYTDSSWSYNCLTNDDWNCTQNRSLLDTILSLMKKMIVNINWVKEHTVAYQDRAHNIAKREMMKL